MNVKQIGLIIGGVVVLAIVGVAVFLGTRMLSTSPAAPAGDGNFVMMKGSTAGTGPGAMKQLRIDIEKASELPDRPSDANGVFVRSEDNSYFVGTGEVRVMVAVDPNNSAPKPDLSYDGPVVEVVITRDTQLYKDTTGQPDFNSAQNGGEIKLQQIVEAVDSLDEVDDNTTLEVWGEKRGDRIIADTVVYHKIQAMVR